MVKFCWFNNEFKLIWLQSDVIFELCDQLLVDHSKLTYGNQNHSELKKHLDINNNFRENIEKILVLPLLINLLHVDEDLE